MPKGMGTARSTRLIVGTTRLNSRNWPEGGVSCLRRRPLTHQPNGAQGVDVLLSHAIQADLLEQAGHHPLVVAPIVADGAVDAAVEPHVRRHDQDQLAARLQHVAGVAQRRHVILDVLEDVEGEDRVDVVAGKVREGGAVASATAKRMLG